jgi:sulfur-carrier protein
MKIIYFAWVRERIGKAEETVSDLLLYLKGLGEEYEAALQMPKVIRVAINQEHVEHSELIAGAREIALFPPMTGG